MQPDELMSHLENEIAEFVEGSYSNYVSMRYALIPSAAGLKLFEKPLIAIAAADDPLFAGSSDVDTARQQMRLPSAWLPNATCVISYFLPMTEQVRKSNYEGCDASPEWLHVCDEGKMFSLRLGEHVERIVRKAGYEAVCPACHPEMLKAQGGGEADETNYSGWSEFSAAYASGLGTYSLSGGIITEAGVAGRLGSVVVSAPLPVTQRPYTSKDEYCTKCRSCVERCPVGALPFDSDEKIRACFDKVSTSPPMYPGYTGCGKCMVNVPCESRRP